MPNVSLVFLAEAADKMTKETRSKIFFGNDNSEYNQPENNRLLKTKLAASEFKPNRFVLSDSSDQFETKLTQISPF